jgi:hypothetical protein
MAPKRSRSCQHSRRRLLLLLLHRARSPQQALERSQALQWLQWLQGLQVILILLHMCAHAQQSLFQVEERSTSSSTCTTTTTLYK